MTDALTVTCANHPRVETAVSCGKCEKPLCPKCMIFTPVGVRCKECARMRPPPQYDVSGAVLVRVVGTAAALVVVLGGLIGFLHLLGLSFLLPMAVGLGVGEALSRVARRKRGRVIEVIAGVTVALTLFAGYLGAFLSATHGALGLALPATVSALTGFYGLLGLVLGVLLAVGRIR